MNSEIVKTIVVLAIVFGTGVVIAVGIAWLEYRKRTRALDVIRIYAERGEEPPASVLQALTNISGYPPYRPTPLTRGGHLAHVAANAVAVAGLVWLAWWRASAFGEKGPSVVVPILVALFFAMSLAARLVYAYHATDR